MNKKFLFTIIIASILAQNMIDVNGQYFNQNYSDQKIERCHPGIPECVYDIKNPETKKDDPLGFNILIILVIAIVSAFLFFKFVIKKPKQSNS